MSLDSHVQIRKRILKEIQDWSVFWTIESTDDEDYELAEALFNVLYDEGAIDPATPPTCGHDDEHYN